MNLQFIDTNILVYAYDADAGAKHTKARNVLRKCWKTESGAVSMQVLQEFYVTVTRKLVKTITPAEACNVIRTYQAWPIYRPTVEDLLTASELGTSYSISFWDALIIVSAQQSGANNLLSEDLQDGQTIRDLNITNPLK